jgi:hypothetical protein
MLAWYAPATAAVNSSTTTSSTAASVMRFVTTPRNGLRLGPIVSLRGLTFNNLTPLGTVMSTPARQQQQQQQLRHNRQQPLARHR